MRRLNHTQVHYSSFDICIAIGWYIAYRAALCIAIIKQLVFTFKHVWSAFLVSIITPRRVNGSIARKYSNIRYYSRCDIVFLINFICRRFCPAEEEHFLTIYVAVSWF